MATRSHSMATRFGFFTLLLSLIASTPAFAGVVTPQQVAPWQGFMNVFELPANGGGFVFSSPWAIADLSADFDAVNETITLTPNSISDPDPFWYQGGGGPGAPGNKIMDAVLFVQDDSLAGQNITFQGFVLSNTYTTAHTAYAFIRDFAPDFSSFNEERVDLTSGAFSLNMATNPAAGRHIQYGFVSNGVNVWSTDLDPFGSVVISTAAASAVVPEPSTLAIWSVMCIGLVGVRHRKGVRDAELIVG